MKLPSTEQIAKMSVDEQQELLELITQYEEVKKYNRLKFFEPYAFQKQFYENGKDNVVRALICANRVGKTYSCSMEIAMHLTGEYPDWWDGKVYTKPIVCVAAGVSSVSVKRVLQKEFYGTENRNLEAEIGTGSIPKANIINEPGMMVKGRDGLIPEASIRHKSGGYSTLIFNAYTQDVESLMGFTADIVYIDEQDKNGSKFDAIISELRKRISTSREGGLLMASFTPLAGLTHAVRQFWEPTGQFHSGLSRGTWDDVTHLPEVEKKEMLGLTPPHLHDAVSKGVPVLGSGAVFALDEDEIAYDNVVIDDHWPRICGVDVGFTIDPTAAVFVAKDPSTDIYYIYDEYGDVDDKMKTASDHVGPLYSKGCGTIPMIYDSAAAGRTGSSGRSVAEMWRDMGLYVLPDSFSNPKYLNEQGSGYKAIAPGLIRMYELMKSGKLKVHKNCLNWWREFRNYAYDDTGQPSKKDNHWMDASRYAIMTAEKGLMEVMNDNSWNTDYDNDDYFVQTWH